MKRVYFNLKPCWEAWDVYTLNSDVLPTRSCCILRITFCLPAVPVPAPGCPPAGSSPGLEKEGWPSPWLGLRLLVPAYGCSHSPLSSQAPRLLSSPSPFAAWGRLPYRARATQPALGADAALPGRGRGAKGWVFGLGFFSRKACRMSIANCFVLLFHRAEVSPCVAAIVILRRQCQEV